MSIKRPSQLVTTPSSISGSDSDAKPEIVRQSRRRKNGPASEQDEVEEGHQNHMTHDTSNGTRRRYEDIPSTLDTPEHGASVNDTTNSPDLGAIEEASSYDEAEVEDLLSENEDRLELETDDENRAGHENVQTTPTGPAEIAVDILSPVKSRRIHPFPSLVFSLIAIAAAYFVLHHSGPRY